MIDFGKELLQELEDELNNLRLVPVGETQEEREERRNKRIRLFKQLVSVQKSLKKPEKPGAKELEEDDDEEGEDFVEKMRQKTKPGTIAKIIKTPINEVDKKEAGDTGEIS